MRNTWKGMVLGALSGAAVGLVLDSIDRAARGASTAAHAAPDAAARAGKGARERAIAFVHDSAGLPSAWPSAPPNGRPSATTTRRCADRITAGRCFGPGTPGIRGRDESPIRR